MGTNRKEVFFRKAFSLLLVLSTILTIRAEVRLPRLISDGMILQRNTEIKIWGWASAGEKIGVKFNGQTYFTTASDEGKWEVLLPSHSAGGPYEMVINEISIKDILIGDVWVCSGQSNMELPMRRVLDLYSDEVQNADNSFIRLFDVPIKYDFVKPQEDVTNGSWELVNPQNLLSFSAVAYFFAKDLYERYNIPIGIIKSAAGGSPVQAWISEDNLKHFPDYLNEAKQCAEEGYIDNIRNTENKTMYKWYSELNSKDAGISNWNNTNIDTSDWGTFYLPGYWEDQGGTKSKGSFWFRKDFDLPENMEGKSAILRLGCIVDSDSAFVNGHFVGNITYQYPPRIYNIPEGILKKGKNNVTIRVVNSGGKGGFVEDKPYRVVIGNQYIDLAGEWKYKIGGEMPPLASQTFFQYKPVGLYNGMIAPLTNYMVKGFVWYQGEANTSSPKEYDRLLSTLINDWRSKWDKAELPFIYAQLPNFMEVKSHPSESNWAMLRESQLKVLKNPHTAMAVTVDLGEWNDIHPLNKKDVGHRLALSAMKVAYRDKAIIGSAPIYRDMVVRGNKIVLSFSDMSNGFAMGEQLCGFAIAGEDRKFIWAQARFEGDKIIVSNDNIQNPVAVRYAWADNPQGANLKNKEGLPVSPFRTDDW